VSEFDFILDNIVYSYSSVTTFETCPHAFKLTYIDNMPREQNFYGEFGLFMHDILEKYFNRELEEFELPQYYDAEYERNVTESPPPFPFGLGDKYRNDGITFLENIDFDRDRYEVVGTEESIFSEYNGEHNGISLIIKPDLILKDKTNGEYILADYKTSKLDLTGKTGFSKKDLKKIDEYLRQFYLYIYFYGKEKEIDITKIFVWFIRNDLLMEFEVDEKIMKETLHWFDSTVDEILSEEEWTKAASEDKKNHYFCNFICGVSNSCEYKPEPKVKDKDGDFIPE